MLYQVSDEKQEKKSNNNSNSLEYAATLKQPFKTTPMRQKINRHTKVKEKKFLASILTKQRESLLRLFENLITPPQRHHYIVLLFCFVYSSFLFSFSILFI